MEEKVPDWSSRREEMKKLREEGWTLESIGQQYNITRERVRQIVGNKEHYKKVGSAGLIITELIYRGRIYRLIDGQE